MGGMHYLRVIMLKKLEGMAPAPYPIKNRVNCRIWINLRLLVGNCQKKTAFQLVFCKSELELLQVDMGMI